MNKAVASGIFSDPTRQSVFEGAFKKRLSTLSNHFPGYLEAFEAMRPQAHIEFTPQKQYFSVTQNWAVALENIYGGSNAASQMNALAKSATAAV
jgi:multiple sugar transport system substrate-binding protein